VGYGILRDKFWAGPVAGAKQTKKCHQVNTENQPLKQVRKDGNKENEEEDGNLGNVVREPITPNICTGDKAGKSDAEPNYQWTCG